MKKRVSRAIAILITFVMAATLAGCTTFDNFRHTFLEKSAVSDEDVIYIGVYEPRSGEYAKQGNDEIKGIQLANKIYSNVKGARVELVFVDNQSSAASSKTAIENLISMKPLVIIGSAGETASMVASPAVKDAKIPTITPSATNPMITEDNDYYFRACITNSQTGVGLAEYIYDELHSRNIGIVTIKNDTSSTALTDRLEESIKKRSKGKQTIAFKASVSVDDTEMNSVVTLINSFQPDTVFMTINAAQADILFTRLEQAELTETTFVGTSSWGKDDFIAMMKKHPNIKIAFPSDQMVSENSTTTNAITAETERFLIKYTEMYGEEDSPSENAALGYDAYLIAINAINNAESFEPEAVRKAMAAISGLRCTTGVFTFDDFGNPIRSVNISSIDNGSVVTVYTTSDVTEAEQMKRLESEEEEEVTTDDSRSDLNR